MHKTFCMKNRYILSFPLPNVQIYSLNLLIKYCIFIIFWYISLGLTEIHFSSVYHIINKYKKKTEEEDLAPNSLKIIVIFIFGSLANKFADHNNSNPVRISLGPFLLTSPNVIFSLKRESETNRKNFE